MKNIRKKRMHTIKNCERKVKKCNWLRHLGTKKHREGVENGGGGRDNLLVARARGQEGEVELTIMPFYYYITYSYCYDIAQELNSCRSSTTTDF